MGGLHRDQVHHLAPLQPVELALHELDQVAQQRHLLRARARVRVRVRARVRVSVRVRVGPNPHPHPNPQAACLVEYSCSAFGSPRCILSKAASVSRVQKSCVPTMLSWAMWSNSHSFLLGSE